MNPSLPALPGNLPRSNAELFARSCAVIPGGVNSSIRAFKAVGGTPYIVERADGPYVFDVEGTRYFDLVQSYGAIILGHAHPVVTAAITAAAAGGTSYGAPTPGELLLAEEISSRVPSCERVRLMNSGTEATSTAVRLVRGFTGRDRIVIFHGNFHGATDALLAAGGSGVATLGLPGTAGVPASAVANTLVVPYNVVPRLDDQVAAVFVEPVAANMGVVAPAAGFLEGLRAECDRVGALLVFDEVITGFRLATGGAQEQFGVRADLTTFGKVIGGGLPLAAVAGPGALMDLLAPAGPVYQAGTLSGNPAASAAGLATLSLLDDAAYRRLDESAATVAAMVSTHLAAAGVPHRVNAAGNLFSVFFTADPVTDYESAKRQDTAAYGRFFHELLDRGVWLPPSAYEAWFVSTAHSDRELSVLQAALPAAARAAAG